MNDVNHKGILIVSFGTLHQETCALTIGAIEDDLAKAFPERRAYRAWTSEFIIKKLAEKYDMHCDTISEALQRMRDDGITDLLVQPTHLLDGFENKKLEGILREHFDQFDTIKLGRPILDSADDVKSLADVIAKEIYSANVEDSQTALLLMGHGSAGDLAVNTVYSDLQDYLTEIGLPEVLIGTVEGRPSLDDALARLKASDGKFAKVLLTPLMIVAGNHAVKDMDGDQEDSWKNVLQRNGYEVTTLIKGLGEYWGIRNILIVHAVLAKPLER